MPEPQERSSSSGGPQAGLRLWERTLEDQQLGDLPYKIETNGRGQLVLTPRPLKHSFLKMHIPELAEVHLDRAGAFGISWAVATPGGVKVADVAWISEERQGQTPADAAASPVVPELCVDLAFARGGAGETAVEAVLEEKRALYFAAGAEEVWSVGLGGSVRFYAEEGQVRASRRASRKSFQTKTGSTKPQNAEP